MLILIVDIYSLYNIGETNKGVFNGILPVQEDWQAFVQTLQNVQVWILDKLMICLLLC